MARLIFVLYLCEKRKINPVPLVQIIQKLRGKYITKMTLGASKDPSRIEFLVNKANKEIFKFTNQANLFEQPNSQDSQIKSYFKSLNNPQIKIIGPEMVFGAILIRLALIKSDVIIDRPDLVSRVEEEGDFANLKVVDFIGYHMAKGNNPVEELIKVYDILTKNIIPAAGFITGNFKSISFEQIPEHPIAKINFSDKKNVTIKAKNNVIELSL